MSLSLISLQASLAYMNGTLFVFQMRAAGLLPGIPFIGHLGMWFDAILITPLLYVMIKQNSQSWDAAEVRLYMMIGIVASYFMHESYKGSKFPEAHVMNGELTSVGYVHMGYMAVAICIILLSYFATEGGEAGLIWVSTGLLTLHVIVGTHVPMRLLKLAWFPPGPAFDMPTVATILGSATLLIGASLWATR